MSRQPSDFLTDKYDEDGEYIIVSFYFQPIIFKQKLLIMLFKFEDNFTVVNMRLVSSI